MLQVPDVQEAMQAGAEKRTPKFDNLLP
jgi:hypothetical protein